MRKCQSASENGLTREQFFPLRTAFIELLRLQQRMKERIL